MKYLIKNKIRSGKNKIYKTIIKIENKLFKKKKLCCSICKNKTVAMMGMGTKGKIFKQKNIVGGGYRKNAICPYCYSSDRERFINKILEKYTDIYNPSQDSAILHIAPEINIKKQINKTENKQYITGDISIGKASVVVDITKMNFEDNKFDYFICNHVLEHVTDDKLAISETYRVLKKGGKAFISVPIDIESDHTIDKKYDKPEDKLIYYGQEDHCRLYGNDIKQKFENAGFKVTLHIANEELDDDEIKLENIIPNDRIYELEK